MSYHHLLEYIHAQFRESFGEPYSTLGRDSQWSLRPNGRDGAPTVFVLVNGSHEKPALWVFDPYAADDSVWKTGISSEQDVDSGISEIRKRLAAAAG